MNRVRIMFLVNGDGRCAMAERARALAARLADRFEIEIEFRHSRGPGGAMRFLSALRRVRPHIVYVLDMSAAGVIAAACYRLFSARSRLVIDTGDAIYELVRSSRMRGPIGQWLTWRLERAGQSIADHLVVRGTFHKQHLVESGRDASRITVVPDGVDSAQFAPREGADDRGSTLRDQLGLNGELVVGVVGSSLWSERLAMCTGWELVEAMRWLKERPVKAVMIGDGSGIARLRERCRALGVEDRVRFVGRVAYERLPEFIGAMDVCLSTQTNDIAGNVRTTGKLPLYLASGRHVLASRVGEAARVLPETMLLDYAGARDESYPQRLAARIGEILDARRRPSPSSEAIVIARREFDYDVLAARVGDVIAGLTCSACTRREDQAEASSTTAPRARDISLAVLCDYAEEGWPSMDLAADMLLTEIDRLKVRDATSIRATRVHPAYRRRLARVAPGKIARNADRLINRTIDYPRHIWRLADRFDLFHVADHSYAHLLLDLPVGRAGVFCHDLDAFRCLLDPRAERRPRWFREMARRILRGMQRATVVFVASESVRRQVVEHELIDAAKLVYAPLGVAPEFQLRSGLEPQMNADERGLNDGRIDRRDARAHCAEPDCDEPDHDEPDQAFGIGPPFVLHVGSCIARKRIDVLLDAFAAVRRCEPVRLIQVGGEWTDAQRRQIARLGLSGAIEQRRGLGRAELASLYRSARAVLITSDAEGFGLPMIEALACGAAVVASDIPPLRETGGDAARYASVADADGFAAEVASILRAPATGQEIRSRIAQAARFSWAVHAKIIADAYVSLASPERMR